MRACLLAFLALLCVSPCLSAENNSSAAQVPYEGIMVVSHFIFPEGEQHSIENFTHGGKTYYGVSSPESGLLAIFHMNWSGQAEPLTSVTEIEPALAAYYLSKGYNKEALNSLEDAHQGFQKIRENRRDGEKECFRLMGLEGRPCFGDYETCKTYCIGTPFCNSFAYGGQLGEFIRVMLEFENLTMELDRAYENEDKAYSRLSAGANKDSVSDYLAAIGGVNRAATKVSSCSLFYAYSFCFAPKYELPTITALQLSAQTGFRLSSPFLTLTQGADNVRNRTLDGLSKMAAFQAAELERLEEIAKNQSLSNSSNLTYNMTGNFTSPPARPEKEETGLKPEHAVILGAALIFLAGCAVFFLVSARRRSHREKSEAFEHAEKELSADGQFHGDEAAGQQGAQPEGELPASESQDKPEPAPGTSPPLPEEKPEDSLPEEERKEGA